MATKKYSQIIPHDFLSFNNNWKQKTKKCQTNYWDEKKFVI